MLILKVVGKSFGRLLVEDQKGRASLKNEGGISVTSTRGNLQILQVIISVWVR